MQCLGRIENEAISPTGNDWWRDSACRYFDGHVGAPLVGEDTVKQAYFRDGKANYNDIVWWPKGGGWKNQSPTPNVNTRYMYFFINTRQDGPVVVELPPAVPGASFYGTIEDAWYVPLTDIGFEGKGGKYLVLPPDYKGDVPDGSSRCVQRPTTP